jgi:hypothetical protein
MILIYVVLPIPLTPTSPTLYILFTSYFTSLKTIVPLYVLEIVSSLTLDETLEAPNLLFSFLFFLLLLFLASNLNPKSSNTKDETSCYSSSSITTHYTMDKTLKIFFFALPPPPPFVPSSTTKPTCLF